MSFYIGDVFRRDTFVLDLEVTLNRAVYNLSGCSLFFTVKRNYSDDDNDALIKCSLSDGITVTDAANGKASIYGSSAKTTNIPVRIPLFADVQLVTPSQEVYTLDSGIMVFQPDQTGRTS